MTRRSFDVGLIVPLAEEFRFVVEVAPVVESIQHDGTYFYRLDLGIGSAICGISGQMGTLPALQTANRLLQFADVRILAVVGVGGSLDSEVALGDVVVADEVNEFQANSKAQAIGGDYEIRYSGRHWPLAYAIREAIRHFEFSARSVYETWRATATGHQSALPRPTDGTVPVPQPSLHVGPIASGNIVAASNAFVEEIKRINRKFIAIDMEAAGVVAVATDRVQPIPWLIVRGISDQANEQKTLLDAHGRGAWRRYAVRNAAALLCQLIRWNGFRTCCGLDESGVKDEAVLLAELVRALQGTLGAPLLAGLAFGSYSHAPIRSGESPPVPIDISGLLLADSEVHGLVEEAKEIKATLCRDHDLATAVGRFAHLAVEYRERLASPAADALLTELDDVVAAIACPRGADEEVNAMLLESEHLEKSAGPDSALSFLAGAGSNSQRVRARKVDLFAQIENWEAVVSAVEGVPVSQLSRSELEHAIFAFAKIERPSDAGLMIRQHREQHTDRAAELFRRGLASQFAWLQLGEK